MRRRLLTATTLLGLVGLAACVPETRTVVVHQQAACNTAFRVINNSSGTVERLYFSHSSLGGWGTDQLGQNVLPPGRSASYRAANTGNYDFRVVWQNGRSAELMRVNVCAASNIVVTNRGLVAS
jgi:hypothetical protein